MSEISRSGSREHHRIVLSANRRGPRNDQLPCRARLLLQHTSAVFNRILPLVQPGILRFLFHCIVCQRRRQNPDSLPQGQRRIAVHIPDGRCIVIVSRPVRIAVLWDHAVVVIPQSVVVRNALQEEIIRITDAPFPDISVAVRDIGQIAFAIDMNHIPHMASGAGFAGHGAFHKVARHIADKCRKIAEILKCLCISLADHLGLGIAVKYPDELPGIAIGSLRTPRRIVIIGNPVAYRLFIGRQLRIIRFPAVRGHDRPGIRNRFGDPHLADFGFTDRRMAFRVFARHGEYKV